MESLIAIDSPKPEKRKLKKRFKVLLCVLIFFLIILMIRGLVKFYNYVVEEELASIKDVQVGNQTLINENTKLDCMKKIKENYSVQKANIIQLKKQIPVSEKQYNNIMNIYENSSDKKIVYLTFDDGPSENITPLILNLLKQENIKVTFFLLGSNTELYPQIVQREYSEGHFLANHGYSHKYSQIYQNPETILNDFQQCEQSIKKALNNENYTSKIYRFPGGSTGGRFHDIKAQGKELLKENHIAYLDWNALTCDAEGTPTHESILENLEKTVGNKQTVVLLMHDSSSKILTYETLPEVIAFFRERGYTFRTLYDVL